MLEQYKNSVAIDQIMDVMDEVSVNDWTMWSSVYNLTTGDILLTHRKGKDRTKRTKINMK